MIEEFISPKNNTKRKPVQCFFSVFGGGTYYYITSTSRGEIKIKMQKRKKTKKELYKFRVRSIDMSAS